MPDVAPPATATGPTDPGAPEPFCGHCGQERAAQHGPGAGGHERCDRAARLEPPRYCRQCRRRMVVQVTPTGWTARCSRHGEVRGAPA